MISVPLLVGKNVIGTLNVHSSTRTHAFDEEHLHILSLLANQAAVAIENARLYTSTAESEQRYRSLFEKSLDGIVLIDTEEGQIVDANPAFQKMLGYSLGELTARKIWEIRAPEHRDIAYNHWLRYRSHGPEQGKGVPYQSKRGEIIEADFSGWYVETRGQRTWVASIRDVTEKRQLEEQLRQSQKMEAIGTLAGGIAHDFNNLLGSILGYASFVKDSLPPNDPARADVEVIERSARRGADLTRQLLAFARGGRYKIEPVNINLQVREVVQLLARTVDKSIAINTDLAEDAAPVEGDEGQISQLLLNLCLNACEAMPGGGYLTIQSQTLHLDAEAAARKLGKEAGAYTLLTITDTGYGIEPQNMERVFEPFFSTKKMQPGKKHSGLGLATVFGIVKGHNGVIQIDSEVGRGTTFRVWLPANAGLSDKLAGGAHFEPAMAGGRETVLVVDDEESLRDMLDRVLSAAGYTVLLASNGEEAVRIFDERKDQIDLVILDMIMPGMSGRVVFQRLRELKPNARVLLSSGYSEQGQAQDILDSGACGFIQKPFSFQDILSKSRIVLDQAES